MYNARSVSQLGVTHDGAYCAFFCFEMKVNVFCDAIQSLHKSECAYAAQKEVLQVRLNG